ncbi:hypothetical protein BGI41_07610 [Methanobrevibacter sp. 87.7]|uniref:hypothetical protein n=1 Tax=Methanobrevibacter sp. 87.7 TaxID=387957 RepID=UPI000B506E4C|nr:hypothetical protein [Methanobrevibacter sp. 87.7]OWT32450.1 hypothetical protein BGI41_07610 [Methanobrevibacter sp. 87.7]
MRKSSIVLLLIIIILFLFVSTANVLFLAEDTSESIQEPGVDMAALWSLSDGFRWIYPGSSVNAEGSTLHNIFLFQNNDPYGDAKDIIEYTYHVSPNVCVVINNNASDRIFGSDMIGSIRENNWGEGQSRGNAIDESLSTHSINFIGVIESLLTGDMKIFLI